MKLAIALTMFLALQAPPPVPREAIENSGGQNNASQGISTSPPAPGGQFLPSNRSSAPNPNQQTTSNEAGQNENAPIFVRVLSIRKDTTDYIYIGGSLLLTLITLTIAVVAFRQAKAALLSAEAVIGAERAWILLDEVMPKMGGAISNYPYRMNVPLLAQFKNYGKTPAWIVESCCKFIRTDTVDFQGPMTYGNPVPCGNYALAPNNGIFPLFPDGQTPLIELYDIERIIGGQGALVLYGLVRYRDVFKAKENPVRETYFCVRLVFSPDRTVEMWQLTGPTGANRCT